MNIQKFSKITNVSAHTIRYYEKIGLLKNIERNASGHRFFTSKDVDWVSFVKRLKDMGMPLNNIQKYAVLREKGEPTSELRKKLLENHVLVVEGRIAIELQHLKKIKEKIEYYNEIINNAKKG
jgi:DNA-binding transcriptional MerR regulator